MVEPCADFRNEVCLQGLIETSAGDFETAACRVNRWQDCVAQGEADDCTNMDKRDCLWLPAVSGMLSGGQGQSDSKFSNPSTSQSFSNPTATGGFTGNVIAPITGNSVFGGGSDEEEEESTETNRPGGICVPNFPPGLEFWEESSAQPICGQANAKCVVVYEKGLIGGEKIVEGEECLEEGWATSANRVCAALGDCGGYVNYNGEYTDDGYKWVDDGAEKKFAPNTVNIISGGFTGMVTGLVVGGLGRITGKSLVDMQGNYMSPPGYYKSNLPVGGGGGAPATFAQGTASATGEVIAYAQGGALAPGSYTAGTIGGHTLTAGQTAVIL